jgi:hypothetical protein
VRKAEEMKETVSNGSVEGRDGEGRDGTKRNGELCDRVYISHVCTSTCCC